VPADQAALLRGPRLFTAKPPQQGGRWCRGDGAATLGSCSQLIRSLCMRNLHHWPRSTFGFRRSSAPRLASLASVMGSAPGSPVTPLPQMSSDAPGTRPIPPCAIRALDRRGSRCLCWKFLIALRIYPREPVGGERDAAVCAEVSSSISPPKPTFRPRSRKPAGNAEPSNGVSLW
jgi:hypothetical protein